MKGTRSMKTIKSGIWHLGLLVNLMCWLAGVWGCSGKTENALHDKIIYKNDTNFSEGTGCRYINDTTILGYQTFGTKDTQWVKFTVDAEHFNEAFKVANLYLFGFYRLNLMAQKEYVRDLKYVKDGKWAMKKEELSLPQTSR